MTAASDGYWSLVDTFMVEAGPSLTAGERASIAEYVPPPPMFVRGREETRRWAQAASIAAAVAVHQAREDPAIARSFAIGAAHALYKDDQLVCEP